MRSFVSTPMRHGRLFLAGDAAHIVPPTGAKGLNLAVADVTILATALVRLLKEKQTDLVDSYSDRALARVWRCTHFSWFMTSMLHRSGDDFDAELQLAQLRRITSSETAARELAENYTGLPLEALSRPLPPATLCPWPVDGGSDGTRCSRRPTPRASRRCGTRPRPARSATRSGGGSGSRCRARRWPTGTGTTAAPTPSSR